MKNKTISHKEFINKVNETAQQIEKILKDDVIKNNYTMADVFSILEMIKLSYSMKAREIIDEVVK